MIAGHPLRMVKNRLRCGACTDLLPGVAAGGKITATYHGPIVTHVEVRIGSKLLHECDPHKAPETG